MIPVLIFVGGLYYANRIMGTLTSIFFGSIILEGRLAMVENEEHQKNQLLGLNPAYQKYLLENHRHKLKTLGVPEDKLDLFMNVNPPSVRYIPPFVLKENELPVNHKWLAGQWLLTESEEAQFRDVLKRDNLDIGTGDEGRFEELCRTHGIDPNEMAKLTWPISSSIEVDIPWLRKISNARLSDKEFMATLRAE